MNKLINLLGILAFAVSGIFAVTSLFAANKAVEEKRVLRLALEDNKTYRYSDLVTYTIEVLEDHLKSIERNSGIRPPSVFIEEEEMPSVFRYRAKHTSLSMNKRLHFQKLLQEINDVLDRVILFDYLTKAYPSDSQVELVRRYIEVQSWDTSRNVEIKSSAQGELSAILSVQRKHVQRIDSLTLVDVQELRNSWFKLNESK